MACGGLYVLKKYDEKYTSLNYMYNTHTGMYISTDCKLQSLFKDSSHRNSDQIPNLGVR